MLIYDELMKDDYIVEQAAGRIKFYEYPETGDVTGPYIVIDPLDVPMPSDFADNTYLTEDYIFQIDVWTKNRLTTKKLAKRIQDILWKMNFPNSGGGMDEYDKESEIYRDARRYRGKLYTEEFEDAQ